MIDEKSTQVLEAMVRIMRTFPPKRMTSNPLSFAVLGTWVARSVRSMAYLTYYLEEC